jgi:hypothetical protein
VSLTPHDCDSHVGPPCSTGTTATRPVLQPGPVIPPASLDRSTVTRVIARLYLPVEMGAVAKVMAAIAESYPDAKLGQSDDTHEVVILVTEPNTDPVTWGSRL